MEIDPETYNTITSKTVGQSGTTIHLFPYGSVHYPRTGIRVRGAVGMEGIINSIEAYGGVSLQQTKNVLYTYSGFVLEKYENGGLFTKKGDNFPNLYQALQEDFPSLYMIVGRPRLLADISRNFSSVMNSRMRPSGLDGKQPLLLLRPEVVSQMVFKENDDKYNPYDLSFKEPISHPWNQSKLYHPVQSVVPHFPFNEISITGLVSVREVLKQVLVDLVIKHTKKKQI